MAISVKRKITFYEMKISGHDQFDTREYLIHVCQSIVEANNSYDATLDLQLANGNYLHIKIDNEREISSSTGRIFGKSRLVKPNEFPSTWDTKSKEEKNLGENASATTGVTQETHFVIDLRYNYPIIGVETTQGGPSPGNIMYFLETWLKMKMNVQGIETSLDFILGRNARELVDALSECASLRVRVKTQNIGNIIQIEKGLGTALASAQEYAGTEYVDILTGYNFRTKIEDRGNTSILLEQIKKLLRLNEEQELFSNFEKLEINAQEGSDTLKPFDLIASKTSVVVKAERRENRHKNLNSRKLYHEIEKEIGNNFGAPEKSSDGDIRPIPAPTGFI